MIPNLHQTIKEYTVIEMNIILNIIHHTFENSEVPHGLGMSVGHFVG